MKGTSIPSVARGFSKQEIADRMKKSGYDDEVISMAYKCYYQQKWIIALSVVCVILVAFAVFAFTRSPKISAYGSPPPSQIKHELLPVSQKVYPPVKDILKITSSSTATLNPCA